MSGPWSDDLVEAARREGALVWFSAWPQPETAKVEAAFGRRFPFLEVDARRVAHPFDIIARERDSNDPTVDTAGPISATTVASMAGEGYFLPYRSPQASDLPAVFADAGGRWYSTHSMGMSIAYNRDLVPPEHVPQSYDDLLHPRWRGRILMEDIRDWGTSAEWALGVHQHLGDTFFQRLARQDVQWYVEGAVTGALDALAAGKHALAPWSVDYMVQLRMDAGGPLGWTNPLLLGRVPANVILARAPHPNAARLFADWLLSEEGQTLIGRENLGFPARSAAPCYMAQFYPADVEFHINEPADVARKKQTLVEMYQRVFFAGG